MDAIARFSCERRRLSASLARDAPWFAFVVHPRNTDDVRRAGLGAGYSDVELAAALSGLPAIVIGDIRFGFSPCHGELIGATVLPEQIMAPDGWRSVQSAVQVGAARGATIVGLGGLTAPATGAGLRLVRHLPGGVTLTNGNGYTAAVVCQNVLAALATRRHRSERVAVVGCTGSVGLATSRLLAEAGCDLVFVDRSAQRAESVLGPFAPGATFAGDLGAARDAGVIAVLTNDVNAALVPGILSPGSIVIDVAQPPNIPLGRRPAFRARDIEVVDGGLVHIPGYTCSYDLKTPARAATFACLAETYLFSREGLRDHSVGRPSVEHARRMERVAARHGVTPCPLELSRDRPVVGDGWRPSSAVTAARTSTSVGRTAALAAPHPVSGA